MSEDDEDRYLPITSRIGRVAAAWARFEYRASEIIWHLANVDIHAGACMTAQIQSPSNRLRALIALVRFRCEDEKKVANLIADLNAFAVNADSLARQRNRFVHDPWIAGGDLSHPLRVEVTADRKLRFEAVETQLPDMDRLWRQIASAIETLEELYARIKAELPPWPDTQHKQSLDKDPTRGPTGPSSAP